MSEKVADLSRLGKTFDASTFDWHEVRRYNIRNCCVSLQPGRSMTCGRILAHARNQITLFRESIGVRICVFKIGVTSNPIQRFISYLESGFTDVWVLTMSDSRDLINMLEAACISHFSIHVGCRNQSETGGEGALNRANPPMSSFYLYVTGGMADQPRRVG